MASINTLFPLEKLSKTEEDLLLEIYSNPVVKKHLTIMAMEESKELLSLSAISNSDVYVSKALATVQGKLSVLAVLQEISTLKPKE
jgi:hypothetical protein